MSRFTVELTLDEVGDARRAAKKRGDAGPMRAIGEQAIAVACRRRWEGTLVNFEKWDSWKKIGRVPRCIEVRLVDAVISDLDLVQDTPEDTVVVLVGTREAPRFLLIGWAFAGDVQQDKYWREDERKFVMPHMNLRSCYELKRQPRKTGRRLHRSDPADDFAGYGGWPMMLDTDDGRHPKFYGNLIRSKWSLPCRRCQTLVVAGQLQGGNYRTGTIHGDPEDCGFKIDEPKKSSA
jgi:hypothetical protein